jgi:PAS domain S-box-containing protein
MLGYPDRESLLAINVIDGYVNPQDRKQWQALIEHKGAVSEFETCWRRYDGTAIWVLDSARTIRHANGRVLCYEGAVEDITDRKRAEEQIQASLREKEVLLKEIHHRVKNNLQIISSLLDFQSEYIKDQLTLEMFREGQNRIRSMALIHEQLYQSKDLARIDFAEYVRDLTDYLFQSYGASGDAITLEIHIADILLGIDTAIPCGLIINELVSNALKYAFPLSLSSPPCAGGKEGRCEILVALHSDNDQLTLIVSDNGVGFPRDLDFLNAETLGLRLVNMLSRQLKGTIELDRNDGTTLKITFARPKP